MKDSDKDELIAKLRAELDTLQTIISMLPGHVYWKSNDNKYLGCNQNTARVLGLQSETEIIGKTATDLIGPELAVFVDDVDKEVMTTEQGKKLEEPGLDVDNKPAVYLTQKYPLYDSQGHLQGLLGVSFDITDRKKIEKKLKIAKQKAEAANRAKSRFLAMVSHELRTPLTSILGFANLLEKNTLPSHKKSLYTHNLINSGSYLLSLINNLLDYSKLETNKFELVNLPFNLKNLVENVITMLSEAAHSKHLALRLHYDKNIPEQITGDIHAIQQILINLVSNAIKFTETGYIAIHIKCIKTSTDFVHLEMAVQDTGMGIPTGEINSIFKHFYQLGNVYTRNKSLTGTGLGLAIVKKLVKLIGGKIKVKSKLNLGSTFTITVPFRQVSINDANYLSKLYPETSLENFQKYNIELTDTQSVYSLLVEDDAMIQIIHRQMLEELNCHVDIASCATEALNMIQENYHILFVDIGLPDMDGFKLIKTIRKKLSAAKQIPIIALTGFSEKEEQKRCLRAGADEVAIKPITKIDLQKIINRYIKINKKS